MHPEIFSIGGFTIQTYGLMMAIGFLLCYFLALHLAKRTGRNPDDVQHIVMIAAMSGVIGARIVYVWQNWQTEFAAQPLQMFAIWKGGLVFYGGFILAAIALLVYAYLKKERLIALADFCAIFVPLGHVFGRLGCFFFGCCFGKLAPDAWYAVSFPRGSPPWLHQVNAHQIYSFHNQSLPVCPTQLIEAAGCAVLFALLWWLYRRYQSVTGLCTTVYCAGYALLRFGVEMLRDDPRGETYFGMSFSQTISVALFVIAFVLLLWMLKRKNHGTSCS